MRYLFIVIAVPQLRSTSQRSSYTAVPNSSRRQSAGTSSAALPSLCRQVPFEFQRVVITDSSLALDPSASSLKDLQWPTSDLKDFADRDVAWKPEEGHEFEVVHKFERLHSDMKHRNEEVILLLKSNEKYLLIPESGVKYLPDVLI